MVLCSSVLFCFLSVNPLDLIVYGSRKILNHRPSFIDFSSPFKLLWVVACEEGAMNS